MNDQMTSHRQTNAISTCETDTRPINARLVVRIVSQLSERDPQGGELLLAPDDFEHLFGVTGRWANPRGGCPAPSGHAPTIAGLLGGAPPRTAPRPAPPRAAPARPAAPRDATPHRDGRSRRGPPPAGYRRPGRGQSTGRTGGEGGGSESSTARAAGDDSREQVEGGSVSGPRERDGITANEGGHAVAQGVREEENQRVGVFVDGQDNRERSRAGA